MSAGGATFPSPGPGHRSREPAPAELPRAGQARALTCSVSVTVRIPKKRVISPKPPMSRGLRPRRSMTKP